MTSIRTRHVLFFLAMGAGNLGCVPVSAFADQPPADVAAGRATYLQQCARCHGVTGRGDGWDAKRLYPRPRDLTSGVFKIRDTASGSAPTDEDVFGTITKGLTAGGMPDWRHLDEPVRWQLVAYLKTLSSNFTDNPPQPLSVGSDPGRARTDPAVGKQVYEKLGCAACHGVHGRGNGPSAASLTDHWEMAIRPADLTQGWNYRAGSDPQVIAWRVLTGIDGSPMPSYAEAASPEEIWQLAYYVRSLQEEPRWTMIARAPHVIGALPSTADDPRWEAVPRTDVRLRNVVNASGEMTAPPTLAAVSFKALHDGRSIAFRLTWHDPSEDRAQPPDALAIALQPEGASLGDSVTLQTWPLRDPPALDLYAWSAREAMAREAIAKSYEPVLTGAAPVQGQFGAAHYDDGAWTLVVSRPLSPKTPHGAAELIPGRFVPVAFVVWDGANGWQRAVSMWIDLIVQPAVVAADGGRGMPLLVVIICGLVLVLAIGLAIRKP